MPRSGQGREPKRFRGLIYFIQGKQTRLIKIGWTQAEPWKRLESLQTGSPDKLELLGVIWGYRDWEKQHHDMFRTARSHGEWFQPTEELLTYIGRRAREFHVLVDEARAGRLERSPAYHLTEMLVSRDPLR